MFKPSIKITRASSTRLSEVNFDKLPFGKIFTDHMLVADYEDGKWQNVEIIPFGNISVSPSISALHYGQAFFEGIKAFRQDNGNVAVFRPWKNAERFNKSASRLCAPELPQEIFLEGLKALVEIDKDWVPHNPEQSLYIRPFMFATEPNLGVHPSISYKFFILLCPIGAYFTKNLRVKIETHYTRSADGGMGYAKAAGNYAVSLLPATIAEKEGYDQIIWTDAKDHAYIEETGASNVMFVIDGKLVTPATKDTILDGVTRDSVIQLAKSWGITVEERKVSVTEVLEACEQGRLQEAYAVGTAAVMAPIAEIGYGDKLYTLPDPNKWTLAPKVLKTLEDIRKGRVEDTFGWNFIV